MGKTYGHIKAIIKKYGLKPASRRDFPLFTLSVVGSEGYTKRLKKQLGFSYEAVAGLGGKEGWYAMFNEAHIAEETGKFIRKKHKLLNSVFFIPAKKILKYSQDKLEECQRIVPANPLRCLEMIVDFYPRYMSGLAIYNCFWRYLVYGENKSNLSQKEIRKIARERNVVAEFYPKIEKIIERATNLIGRKSYFDGNLLRYFTVWEMKKFLENPNVIKRYLPILKKRREKYFYLFVEKENKEQVITDKKIIKRIHNEFYRVKREKIKIIKGNIAYKGRAKGIVYNLHLPEDNRKKTNKDFILVANMIHPDDTILIKKCKAVVTDQGGILSHAAIKAREFKKPCIINTKIASRVLKNGDFVEVDAGRGIVRIIEREK